MTLAHHGINRSEVFLTNAAICHPPFKPGKGAVKPTKEVLSACRPRLKAELAKCEPETILLLGNTAKETLYPEVRTGITEFRVGPPREHPDYPGAAVIATFHPAACLRNGDSFPSLLRDVGKANQTIWTKWEPPIYKAFEDVHEAIQALKELGNRYKDLVVDIEVGVDKDSDFSHPDTLLCVGISYRPNTAVVFGEAPCQDQRFRRLLRDVLNSSRVTCHNGKFDIQVLMRMGILDNPYCLTEDTMYYSYALDERKGVHGLKYLAVEELGAPQYDDEIKVFVPKKSDSYALIPRPLLYKYNAYDAALTWNIRDLIKPRCEKEGLLRVHDRLVRYAREFIYVELDGVRLDMDLNADLMIHYTDELDIMRTEMSRYTPQYVHDKGEKFNPNSPYHVKAALEEFFGVRVQSTDAETLNNLLTRARGDFRQFLEYMLVWRDYAKSFGTYVKGSRNRAIRGRLYPTYLLHGTDTGRTACRNPNIQNWTRPPSRMRNQIVPDEGNVFCQADYGQIEGRVATVEAGDEFLFEIFGDPSRDLFDELGTGLFGSLEAAQSKANRVRTKAYYYGSSYGREPFSIAQEFKIPESQAKREQDAMFTRMPQLKAYFDEIQEAVKRGEVLETHFGRRRRFGLITRDNLKDAQKAGMAFKPQSTANDINLSALCELRKAGLKIRNPVHDSILAECAEGDRHEVGRLMVETMERVAAEEFSDRIPFPADVEFGYNWGELSKEDDG
jgi:uracil-DNA glycosylase family 4